MFSQGHVALMGRRPLPPKAIAGLTMTDSSNTANPCASRLGSMFFSTHRTGDYRYVKIPLQWGCDELAMPALKISGCLRRKTRTVSQPRPKSKSLGPFIGPRIFVRTPEWFRREGTVTWLLKDKENANRAPVR
jgi:hypothetical protein